MSIVLVQSPREQHIATINNPALVVALERYQRSSALCGAEARHPLLDKRLVELVTSLPWNQVVRDGWRKWQLRRAAEDQLPRELAWRRSWAYRSGDYGEARQYNLGQKIREKCDMMATELAPYVSEKALATARVPAGNQLIDSAQIWSVYTLAEWLSQEQNNVARKRQAMGGKP